MQVGIPGEVNKQIFKQNKNNVHNGQSFQNKQFNFSKQFDYKQLKLTKMKKQILILLVAFFASMNLIMAQEITPDPAALTSAPVYCVLAEPIAVSCVPAAGPNNPLPGQPYTYTVTVTNGGAATIHWFATTDPDFITSTGLTANIEGALTSPYIMDAGTTYNVPGNTTNNVEITWNAIPATTDVFLVTYVTNGAGCPDNIKVYKIETSHTFTLDIARILSDGSAAAPAAHCISPVFGASYDAINGIVNMDYGVNYLYYVVNAANWANTWLPSFELTAAGTLSTTFAVDWAYPAQSHGAGAVWNSTTPAGDIYTSDDPVSPSTGTTVGTSGECIIVRVTVDHNLNEGLADMSVELAVDGFMEDISGTGGNYTNPLLGDIHHEAGTGTGEECPWYDGYTNDRIAYTLTARPAVVDASAPPATIIPDDAEQVVMLKFAFSSQNFPVGVQQGASRKEKGSGDGSVAS